MPTLWRRDSRSDRSATAEKGCSGSPCCTGTAASGSSRANAATGSVGSATAGACSAARASGASSTGTTPSGNARRQGGRLVVGVDKGTYFRHCRATKSAAGRQQCRPLNSPRNEAYTDDAFREGWREFVRQHEKEAMLYNAMIKGFPSATGEPFHYEFVVDNPAQKDKIESFMPDILQSLRNFVSNDSVMLSVKVRERQPGEKIWNQTELMKEAAERNPKVLEFIKKYQLSLA